MKNKRIIYIFQVMLLFTMASGLEAAIIFEDDFNSYTGSPQGHGWTAGRQVSVDAGMGVGGSNAVSINYSPQSGGHTSPHILRHDVSASQPDELYIQFDVRTDAAADSILGGSKFVKIVGGGFFSNGGTTYSNTTFAWETAGISLSRISYGGASIQGDTQTIFRFDNVCRASACDQNANIVVHSPAVDFKDGSWHSVKFHLKYNSVTNGVNNRDGEYDIWVDGTLRMSVRQVINIHPDSNHYWEQVFLGDYTSRLPAVDTHIWYDNIIVSDAPLDPAPDTQTPILTQITPIQTPTSNSTPSYTFSSNKAGDITYGGDCSSSTTSAVSGNNNITLNSLIDGTYSNCTITVTDSSSNISGPLSINTFTINSSPTSSTKADVDLSGSIDIIDALLTFRNSLELDMTATTWKTSATGDVNCDGVSNSVDVRLILRDSLDLDMSGTGWCVK